MKVVCPHCGQKFEIGMEYVGKEVKCDACDNGFVVSNPNLIACPDCFQPVSRRASLCPHCGAPLNGCKDASHALEVDEEKDVLVCNPAAIYFLWNIVIGILLAPIIVGIPILAVAIVNMKCTVYRITTQRVLVKTGWLNKKQIEIWIKDMRGVNLQQSFWERLIGTGSVSIGTAATAGAEIQMRGIGKAQKVVDLINSLRNG